jgi:hypothetical protein
VGAALRPRSEEDALPTAAPARLRRRFPCRQSAEGL